MNLPEPVAWSDDAALAGGSGNCASAYAKAYWARGDFVDKMTAEKLKHPLFTAAQIEAAVAAAVAQERERCAVICEREICPCCFDESATAAAEWLAERIRATPTEPKP